MILLDETSRKVQIWFGELKKLQRIKVHRSLQRKDKVKSISLHTFVDASQSAYGGVVYVRSEYDNQTVSVTLAAAKTKVRSTLAVHFHTTTGIDGSSFREQTGSLYSKSVIYS